MVPSHVIRTGVVGPAWSACGHHRQAARFVREKPGLLERRIDAGVLW